MQEYSELKALNYVKYKLLGEAKYLDVFGDAAEARYEAQRHYRKTDQLEVMMLNMAAQLADMQKLMFNMAGQLNNEHREVLRYKRAI